MTSESSLEFLKSEILKVNREIQNLNAEVDNLVQEAEFKLRQRNQSVSSGYRTIETPRIYRERLQAEHDSLNSTHCDALPVRTHSNSGIAEHDSLNSANLDPPPVRTYSESGLSEHASPVENYFGNENLRTSTPCHVRFKERDSLENVYVPETPSFTAHRTSARKNETLAEQRQDCIPETPHSDFSSVPLPTDIPRADLSRVNRIPRKAKEPDLYDGKSTDFKDYIVHFEQVANWNAWDKSEMAQQLCMSLRGNAQKLLSDLKTKQITNYYEIKTALEQRFHPLAKSPPSGRNLEIVGGTKMNLSLITGMPFVG
jgi:hypothetical protein